MGILAALSLTSCLGPPVSEELTIEVHAPTEATRLEVETAASFILPVLEERFGVRSGPVTIVVDPSSDTETRGAATGPNGITLFRIALPWIYAGVAHESVHWLLHWQASYWNALSVAVEEGLAQLAFHEFGGIPPPENEIVGDDVSWALTLTLQEFNALESVRRPTYAGSYIARQLGVEGLRGPAMRATGEGLDKIPASWITEALERVAEADGARMESTRSPNGGLPR